MMTTSSHSAGSPGGPDIGPEIELAERLFATLSENTADPPGITRDSYGAGERFAHALMAETARGLDLEITADFAGNLYMTRPGRERGRPAVIIGSHLDSVPHGGNFDGAAGVISGMAAVSRYRRLKRTPAQDITVMAIRAEEMSWFPTHYAGSRMAFGLLPADDLERCRRPDTGRTLAEHMREEGFDPEAVRRGGAFLDPRRIRCYIEPHIEQGPVLVEEGYPVGIVTAIRGNLRYRYCRVTGAYDHAGAVPRRSRRDALLAAVAFVHELERYWWTKETDGTDLLYTVGQFHTDPEVHTITKIPGAVHFTMDIRSERNEVLMEMDRHLRDLAGRIARERRASIDVGDYTNAEPAAMDHELRRLLREEADRLGIPAMEMASGGGHDCAIFANRGVPSAMVFIRNANGSHNPEEAMELDDFAQAFRLLDAVLGALD